VPIRNGSMRFLTPAVCPAVRALIASRSTSLAKGDLPVPWRPILPAGQPGLATTRLTCVWSDLRSDHFEIAARAATTCVISSRPTLQQPPISRAPDVTHSVTWSAENLGEPCQRRSDALQVSPEFG
jgi:hypothetical protein